MIFLPLSFGDTMLQCPNHVQKIISSGRKPAFIELPQT